MMKHTSQGFPAFCLSSFWCLILALSSIAVYLLLGDRATRLQSPLLLQDSGRVLWSLLSVLCRVHGAVQVVRCLLFCIMC